MLQDIAELDSLADQLAQAHPGARMDDVDLDALARQVGDEAAVDARALAELERALRDSGYLTRAADGTLRLSPRAMRELGRSLLRDVAGRLSARQGARDVRAAGAAGEPSGATRAWEFGDTEPWDVTRTMTNALTRTAAEDRRDGRDGIRLDIRDVEVTETEARTRAAVALLVDTSFSMAMDGRWVPMKRTALALHQLDLDPVPRRPPRAHRLRAARRGHEDRAAHRARRDVGEGHQPAPRPAPRQPALPPAPARAARAARRHRRRADLAPRARRRGVLRLPAAPPHPRPGRARAGCRGAARAPRRPSSGSARTPGWLASSSRWPRRAGGRVVAPELGDLGAAVVGSYLGSRSPASPFGASYRDLFGGRGFWAD